MIADEVTSKNHCKWSLLLRSATEGDIAWRLQKIIRAPVIFL